MQFRTHDSLAVALYELTSNKNGLEIIAERDSKTSNLSYVLRLWKLYIRAKETSKGFGYVGVGCISFAESRLITCQRRLARKIAKRES